VGKYQYGHFDGMQDMYINSNSRDDLPQSKYVKTGRKMSDETRNILTPIAEEKFSGLKDNWNRDYLYMIFRKSSLPVGCRVIGIERQDGNGLLEDMYYISYELDDTQTNSSKFPAIERQEVVPGEVSIIEYGPKSIAVIGDTKPIKDKLGRNGLGGAFNMRLSCGPGWIFPKTRLEEITKALSQEEEEIESTALTIVR
jgi:hypothetical protein